MAPTESRGRGAHNVPETVCLPYQPDNPTMVTGDTAVSSLWTALLTHCQRAAGSRKLSHWSLMFSLMPCTKNVFDTWSNMKSPSAMWAKKGLKACFLVAFGDAYTRGWLPLFECPEEWSPLKRPDLICAMARWGSDDDRCIANTPFIQPEPDSDHDDTADRVVTEERDRVRSMIQAWVTHHHSRVQYDTDCDDEYDMHGTTGPVLRNISMETADTWEMPADCSHVRNVCLLHMDWSTVDPAITAYMRKVVGSFGGVLAETALREDDESAQCESGSEDADDGASGKSVEDSGGSDSAHADSGSEAACSARQPRHSDTRQGTPARRITRSSQRQTCASSWSAAVCQPLPCVGPCTFFYPGSLCARPVLLLTPRWSCDLPHNRLPLRLVCVRCGRRIPRPAQGASNGMLFRRQPGP